MTRGRFHFRAAWLLWLLAPLLLYWTLRGVPLANLRLTLGQLEVWKVAVLLLINAAILGLFSSRWWVILRAMGFRLPYARLAAYRVAGFGISYFTPGTQFGGEPLLVYLLQSKHGIPAATAIGSVFLDKLVEVLSNFTFLLIGIGLIVSSGLAGGWIGPWMWVAVAVVLAFPLSHLLALRGGHKPLSALLARLSQRWQGVRWLKSGEEHTRKAEEVIIEFLRCEPQALGYAILFSVLVWAAILGEYLLMLYFLGGPLGLFQTIVVITAARLAFLVPVPAGLGALEAGQVLAMQLLGFDPALGLAISLVIRARDLLIGGIGLWLGAWAAQPHTARKLTGYNPE